MIELSQRERWHRGWLNRLSSMPSWMYRKVVDELMLGATPLTATKLIFDYPEEQRGGLQGLAFRTVQRYLQVLIAKNR